MFYVLRKIIEFLSAAGCRTLNHQERMNSTQNHWAMTVHPLATNKCEYPPFVGASHICTYVEPPPKLFNLVREYVHTLSTIFTAD